MLFPTTKKKPRGCLLVSISSKNVLLLRGTHALYLTLPPLSPRSTPFPTVSENDDDDEGISDDLTRMMGTAAAAITLLAIAMMTAMGARATTGGRLAYLCCAWQYSALSS